jgi:glutamate synthase (NADPH/NADH) small chain
MSGAYSLPADRLERRMPELKPALTDAQAVAEANRCLYCYDAPCVTACPTHINIPEFIRKIATGNLKASARTIFESNILGLSCAMVCPVEVLCAGACVYEILGRPPIEIGKLQRHSTEWAYRNRFQPFKAAPPNGRKVAMVGAGPASLACAAELARLGYRSEIFEGRDIPGGLNTWGVAPYKMYAEDALREVEFVRSIGNIDVRFNEWISKERFAALAEEYDAVFIGVGLGRDSRLGVPGEDQAGVVGAVRIIEELKRKPAEAAQKLLAGVRRAIVVGGGNTSIDVVRELRKLGVPSVTLCYRRAESEMPAYAHEVEYARKEGGSFLFEVQPLEIAGDGAGAARGVKVVRVAAAGPAGADGRARLVPVPGSEMVVEADLVVLAIGQEKLEELLSAVPGLRLDRGRVLVDKGSGQTSNPKYFSGGDCANGGKEVVNAAAEGKRAARGIHAWLTSTARK